jgi:hypothetical protein
VAIILADSFQANWKYEAVFLAIAALCTQRSTPPITDPSWLQYE